MTEMTRIDQHFAPPSPGEVLKRKLIDDAGLTQRQLARALGVSEPRLTMMFKGRCAVSAEIALRIERAFGISPFYWLRIRDEYELYHERQRLSAVLAALPTLDGDARRSVPVWPEQELQAAA